MKTMRISQLPRSFYYVRLQMSMLDRGCVEDQPQRISVRGMLMNQAPRPIDTLRLVFDTAAARRMATAAFQMLCHELLFLATNRAQNEILG
jgi:hypothetical protein